MTELDAAPDRELVFRRLAEPFPVGPPEHAPALWVAAVAVALTLALVWVVRLYLRDARVLRAGAVPLAAARFAVYALVALAFLLPAVQTWERGEKRSKVVLLLDASPSVTDVADERAADPKAKAPTRLDKLLDALTDDRLGLLRNLTARNPVTVYRFGGRLDEEPALLRADTTPWTRADWASWLRGDLKAWVLRGLSPAGRTALAQSPAWDGDAPGSPEWAAGWAKRPDAEAVPEALGEADRAALAGARGRLEKRADLVRAVGQGTDLPGALAAALTREAGNLVQGVVAFSDGRSGAGSDPTFRQAKERAARDRIPLFTVAVGEARDATSIGITDLQAADRAPPDEPFKATVEADGVGLADAEVEVRLGLYGPNKPTRDKDGRPLPPDHELVRPLKFAGTASPPHGAAEFTVDAEADGFPDALTEPSKKAGKKRQLRQGAWSLVARIARDRREVTGDEVHVSPPRPVQVLDKPLRVLLVAGAATREYQTLRTLLVREAQKNRAELSVYLQSEAGRAGQAVQDVPPDRLLTRFPARLDVSDRDEPADDRGGNLNRYDLVVAFDPDWSELAPEQVRNLQEWVDNLGGGLVFVAGPVNSFQLARADEGGRLKPLLDVLPVVLDDAILLKQRGTARAPRRLALRPNPEFDVLRLADDRPADDPVAGWDRFFGGDKPERGFYGFYPVKATKPVSTTLAELLEPAPEGAGVERKPWLVAAQTKRGRGVFLAAGEAWRLRAFDPDYYDRFWVKLLRYAAGNRDVREARGRVLVGKSYPAGAVVRVQARLLAPNARPYPPDQVTPKFTVARYSATGEKVPGVRDEGPFELKPRRSGGEFDGYYAGQFLADPARFPPGDFRYRVAVEVPDGEPVWAEFTLRRADPELDNTKPDFAALEEAAGTVEEVRGRVADPAVLKVLAGDRPDPAQAKLTMRLTDRDRLAAVPACMDVVSQTTRTRGPARDLWDRGPVLPLGDRRAEVSWLLLAAVGLLGIEWLVRKLVRLA